MKKLLFVASALATVLTTSAFAQTQTTPRRVHHYVQRPSTYVTNGQYMTNDPYLVIENDRVVGRDPDPNIRTQLRHDPVPNEY